MHPVNINEDRFRRALFDEFPGLSYRLDDAHDLLNLRFTFQVSSEIELLVDDVAAYDRVKLLAERLRQDVLVKTGASRIVQAANEQAQQYRMDNVRLSRMIQGHAEAIRDLKASIADLQETEASDD